MMYDVQCMSYIILMHVNQLAKITSQNQLAKIHSKRKQSGLNSRLAIMGKPIIGLPKILEFALFLLNFDYMTYYSNNIITVVRK